MNHLTVKRIGIRYKVISCSRDYPKPGTVLTRNDIAVMASYLDRFKVLYLRKKK